MCVAIVFTCHLTCIESLYLLNVYDIRTYMYVRILYSEKYGYSTCVHSRIPLFLLVQSYFITACVHVRIYIFDIQISTIVHSCSIDPWKLCVGVKYYIVHMYSMPYYAYGSTANIFVLEPTVLIYVYQKDGAVTRIYMVLKMFLIE